MIVDSIEGAINIPFSQFATKLDSVPKDKPVIVYCRVGDFSEEIAEILSERGYDVTNLEGGYNAYRKLKEGNSPLKEEKKFEKNEREIIDAKGLKCRGRL